ncbi:MULTISPECIES: glycoside hydrolase family 13 protein [Blautia]|jgi:oligo-1,6-glucosidase|uniref:Alpha,alpha-phosphotrehalase n=1 Tax=Blautia difficilis TaxID=2763027 RepID=A0ABR7ILT3_9FIRM|nr:MULTISPECIES: alpha-glucosidase [Blautia]MBC5780989.1 alpha,alpha-phosphotrehalase [Blautia difficilis]MBE5703400.1 alpha,alpha-phosphotrehalase [Ruminococcus sp.]MBE5705359.1 alpha,alpha-phosphotrehalase [Ruminococcus sp.]
MDHNEHWWQKSVVYQIYPRSFMDSNGDGIGDLQGIISKLDYLRNLGVDVIWLSPFYASPNADNGYDISDYQKIMEEFGTMEDFDELLKEAHQRNLKIIIDMVVNHSSDEHEWFKKSKAGIEPYRNYYIWRKGVDGKEPNNWRSNFSGSAWTYSEERQEYYLHLFHKKQPELNWQCAELRNEIYRMMNWWLDKGVDGFRLDVINYIGKNPEFPDGVIGKDGLGDFVPYAVNLPISHDYIKEMNSQVWHNREGILTVGETPFASTDDAVQYSCLDNTELNMVFQFEHMDLDNAEDGSKWSDRRIPLLELKRSFSNWQRKLYGKAWNSLYWCNHDQPRVVSRLGNDTDTWWNKSAKMLATCLHFMQGTPYVYQGEELGMTNYPFSDIRDFRDVESINAYHEYTETLHVDSDKMISYLRNKSRDNARTPMQWDETDEAGFTTGVPWMPVNPNYKVINAAAQIGDEDSVYNYYRKLISLRKEHPIIVNGDFELVGEDDADVFVYLRHWKNQILWVACNFTDRMQKIVNPSSNHAEYREWHVICDNYSPSGDAFEKDQIELQPYEAVAVLGNP